MAKRLILSVSLMIIIASVFIWMAMRSAVKKSGVKAVSVARALSPNRPVDRRAADIALTALKVEWEAVAPSFQSPDLRDIWLMLDAGQCDQAEALLGSPRNDAALDAALGAQRQAATRRALDLCRERAALADSLQRR
jgi:hypothetical protein